MRVNFVHILPIVFLAFSISAFGQNNAQIEQELVEHIQNIQKWSTYGTNYNDELLSKENDIFREKLLKYTKIASTLDYKFSKLGEYLYISTSEDGKFRIYSWDTEDGGTMHFFLNVYQYRDTSGRVYSKTDQLSEGDPSGFVYDIFSLETKGGKIYLTCSNSIYSTSQAGQSVDLYKIENSSLNDQIKLIKTRSGLKNSLGFEYDFFSVVEREERPIKLIQYDKSAKTIKIPVVIKNDNFQYGEVTKKFIVYKFNGRYFVKTQ